MTPDTHQGGVRLVLCLTFLGALACGGSGSSKTAAWSQSIDLPLHTEEVIQAVAALPECDAVRQGGNIHWTDASLTCGSPQQAAGCSYPSNPPQVFVVMRGDAWDGPPDKPLVSSLAHELCHVCGYTDGPDAEAQANSCAMRARMLAKAKRDAGS